jgi:hypothetical protein
MKLRKYYEMLTPEGVLSFYPCLKSTPLYGVIVDILHNLFSYYKKTVRLLTGLLP